jgi:import receptor subunit TOM20
LKKAEEEVKSTVLQVIEQVMSAAEKEPLPSTPEAKEKYFMEQVAAGESLCNRGKFFLGNC